MDLGELARVIWQRKLVALLTAGVIVALGVASLAIQTRIYRATSTIAITPAASQESIFIISQIDTLTPLYAEAAQTETTFKRAVAMRGGKDIGTVSVRTFHGAPILKIDSESPDPTIAQEGAQAVTDVLLARASAGEIGLSDSFLRVTQIDRPSLPTAPVRPQPKLTLAVSILLALGFGVGAAVAWDRLGRKIETVDELAAATGLSPYGEIPTDRAIQSLSSPQLLVNDQRFRIVSEALRDIRTNLQFTDGAFRSILVTSPEGRHGKTFVSFGLAATLARAGARTLLVDGDLRRGRVAEMMQIKRAPGVMEVLNGFPLERAIRATDLDSLSVLTGGALQDDPGELLEASFFQLLYDLEAAFDVIVVDGTPLVPINDARLMARYVSTVLLVVSAASVTRRQVRTALERLSIIGVTATAAVLNASRTRRRASYYRYLKTD
jgi:receptor protein-tyrosine kinase